MGRETSSKVIELEGMPDHVHLLVEVDPQFGIHRFVKGVKGRSSHRLRGEFPALWGKLPTLGTNSYLVSTVAMRPWPWLSSTSQAKSRAHANEAPQGIPVSYAPDGRAARAIGFAGRGVSLGLELGIGAEETVLSATRQNSPDPRLEMLRNLYDLAPIVTNDKIEDVKAEFWRDERQQDAI